MANRQARLGVTILRVAVASVFVIHGIARTALGTVDDFGVFLGVSGLPAGQAIAWLITGVEIIGGAGLALGFGVRLFTPWFGLQIAAGIALVHANEGWFVVGAGRNGAEYSVLIIACLVAVALTDSISLKPGAVRRAVTSRVRAASPSVGTIEDERVHTCAPGHALRLRRFDGALSGSCRAVGPGGRPGVLHLGEARVRSRG